VGSLATRGFCVVPSWMPNEDVARVQADVSEIDAHGLLRAAMVGSGDNIRADESIRQSGMCSLIPGPPLHVGSADTRWQLTEAMGRLRVELELAPQLSHLSELTPFETELAYLSYPRGGFYQRHTDVPSRGWCIVGRKPCDGSSLARYERRRTISVLLYLNLDWNVDQWGGQLRVFAEPCEAGQPVGAIGRATRAAKAAGACKPVPAHQRELHYDIAPEGGTLVLMRSELVAHEVLTARP